MDAKQIFKELKNILKEHESSLVVIHDKKDNYYLNTPPSAKKKKGEFFGAVQIKKSYVSFHLMPVYYSPELLNDVSEGLLKQMQGKSCFNFKVIDQDLFKELTVLTKSSFDKYKAMKKV